MKKVLHRSVLAALMLLFNILSVCAGDLELKGKYRDFGFSDTSLTATVGQVLSMPSVGNYYDNVTYVSSNENVAIIGNENEIHAVSSGIATITANLADAESNSYVTSSFTLTVTKPSIIGSVENIILIEPNTLRYVLADLETTAIGSLTLHGKVGSEDLALIKEQKGRLENLQELDMGDTELWDDGGIYAKNLEGAFAGMETLVKLVLPSNLTEIGPSIAEDDTELVEVVLPKRIDRIPDKAFNGCAKLTTINLSGVKSVGKQAFSNTQLFDIDLSKVTSIGYQAFLRTLLKSVDLSCLDTIADFAFDECQCLENVKWSTNLRYIGRYAFYRTAIKNLNLPKGLTEVGYSAFMWSKVRSIKLPSTLMKLGWDAFRFTPWQINEEETATGGFIYAGNILLGIKPGWKMPENYTLSLPEGTVAMADSWVSSLENASFNNIVKIVLPSTIKYVGKRIVAGPKLFELAEINLPEGLEGIGEYAFESAKLVTVTVPSTVKEIGDEAFCKNNSLIRVTYNPAGSVGGKEIFGMCDALEKVIVGEKVTEIPEGAFYNCPSLLKVEFKAPSVSYAKSYDAYAHANEESNSSSIFTFTPECFRKCSLLTAIDFPINTDSIGERAFEDTGLKVAKLPWHIRSVGENAFAYCHSLTEAYLPASLKLLADKSFLDTRMTSIYAFGVIPIDVHSSYGVLYFPRLAYTAKLYVRPGYQEVWDAHEVWSAFDIYPMGEDKLALGIESVLSGQDRQDVFFDLSGRRVFCPKPGGIYIKNGKKLIMK